MNDIGYIDMKYKGSQAYTSVMQAKRSELEYKINYTKMAIEYHIKEKNPKQVQFFTDELNLINKRLSLQSCK